MPQYGIFFIKLDVGKTPFKVLLVMLRLMVMPATCIFFLIASILTKTEKRRTRWRRSEFCDSTDLPTLTSWTFHPIWPEPRLSLLLYQYF